MEQIFHKKTLVGIRVSSFKAGTRPITKESEPLQLIALKHPRGAYLKAHYHAPKKRITSKLQECLIVRKGKIKIDLYDSRHRYIRALILKTGEAFILLNGGYGIHIQENAELIEVKNGPFKKDKVLI